MKTFNEYATLVSPGLFAVTPKAVFAAVAVSALLRDAVSDSNANAIASDAILREWWALYHNGIVPQRPSFPEPTR